jgi:hypothetical protein
VAQTSHAATGLKRHITSKLMNVMSGTSRMSRLAAYSPQSPGSGPHIWCQGGTQHQQKTGPPSLGGAVGAVQRCKKLGSTRSTAPTPAQCFVTLLPHNPGELLCDGSP